MAKFQTKAFLGRKPITLPDDATAEWTPVDIEHSATALAVNDLIECCEIPPGYDVLDWMVVPQDIDSGGSPTVAFSIGIENSTFDDLASSNGTWQTGLTGFQTGTVVRSTSSNPILNDRSTTRKVALKCTTAAATYAGSGKVSKLLLLLAG